MIYLLNYILFLILKYNTTMYKHFFHFVYQIIKINPFKSMHFSHLYLFINAEKNIRLFLALNVKKFVTTDV